MPHGAILTEEEHAGWRPNKAIVDFVEQTRVALGLERDAFRVLDLGCGRGQYVMYLRERGYAAYGTDISTATIERGRERLASRGVRVGTEVVPMSPDGTVPFPDRFFDLVFSYYVLEHVSDLTRFAAEAARVTREGGLGRHTFPARWRLMDEHLHMPMVHWLPKNAVRLLAIAGCLALGAVPSWTLSGSLPSRALGYYGYSVQQTFYRPRTVVHRAFRSAGFSVGSSALELHHPTLHRITVTGRVPWLRPALTSLVENLGIVELVVQRSA